VERLTARDAEIMAAMDVGALIAFVFVKFVDAVQAQVVVRQIKNFFYCLGWHHNTHLVLQFRFKIYQNFCIYENNNKNMQLCQNPTHNCHIFHPYLVPSMAAILLVIQSMQHGCHQTNMNFKEIIVKVKWYKIRN
jgi:hypothetical protein